MYRITRNIWQGGFASLNCLDELKRSRITHILNVSETPNQLSELDGPFKVVEWIPIEDLDLIPASLAMRCVDSLHEYVCDGDSNVCIHCVAGWNRSPTILWLYLIACGLEESIARSLIESSSFDAVAGHPKLVDAPLIAEIKRHGQKRFLPHRRPSAIDQVDGVALFPVR